MIEETKSVKRTAGQPTAYNHEIAARICEEIASGKSLRKVCAGEGMPVLSTIFLWLQRHKEFSDQYTRAVAERREVHKESLFDIPREEDLDPSRARLLCDNIKWVLAKEEPKKYGDKIQVDGEVHHEHIHKTVDQLEAEIIEAVRINPLLGSFLQRVGVQS